MSKYGIITIENIIDQANEYLSEDDIELIQHAYHYAKTSHTNQYRNSVEAYIDHTVQIVCILVDLKMDPVTIAGGFLHDVAEDTNVTLDTRDEEYDEEVAMLVDGVTKLGKIKYKSKEALQAEIHRKMFV